jgi:predicted P-loop ATPase
MNVVIDGVIYVPAIEAVPGIDDIMQALYEQYMGSGRYWRDDEYTKDLRINVHEDEGGQTFEEFAARISKIISRGGVA